MAAGVRAQRQRLRADAAGHPGLPAADRGRVGVCRALRRCRAVAALRLGRFAAGPAAGRQPGGQRDGQLAAGDSPRVSRRLPGSRPGREVPPDGPRAARRVGQRVTVGERLLRVLRGRGCGDRPAGPRAGYAARRARGELENREHLRAAAGVARHRGWSGAHAGVPGRTLCGGCTVKNWILALLAALCAAVGVATLRAAAQSVMTGPRTPPGLGTAAPEGSAAQAVGADAWHLVRQHPTTTSTRHLGSVLREAQPSARALSLVAAELARRLTAHPPASGERIWIAAPAGAERFGLGALLGVARQLGLSVDGFVDAAVVSAAALGGTGAAIVVELGLHHVAATLIERDGGPTCRRRSLVSARGGLWLLYQGWLDLINTAMVRQTRFDALHDAATEQQLFEALPRLARDAMAQGVATAALTTAGERVEVPVTRDQLAHAAQPVWREIARLLHELRPAGGALTLLVPRAVAGLPGVREALAQFAGCELVSLPAGFAAAATSLLDLTPRSATEPVRLLRRLPSGAEPALAALAQRESAQADAPWLTPSHVLFAGRTFALGAEPLVVGRDRKSVV